MKNISGKNLTKHKKGVHGLQTQNVADRIFAHALENFQKNEIEKAFQSLQELIQISPVHFDGIHLLGIVQAKLNLLDDALQSLEKARAINPNDLGMLNNYGMLLLNAGKAQEAVEIYSGLIEQKHSLLNSLLNRARAYEILNEENLSIADVLHAKELAPFDKDVQLQLVMLYFHFGKLEQAKSQLLNILSEDEWSLRALNLLGKIAVQEKRFADAINIFYRALTVDSKQFEALLGIGISHLLSRRFEIAIQYFDQCISISPNASSALFNRALSYKELNHLPLAQADLLKVIELEPGHWSANINLALIYKENRIFCEAKKILLTILSKDEFNFEANLVLAQIYKDTLKIREARDVYKKLLDHYPNHHFIQWSKLFLNIPALFEHEADVIASRNEFRQSLLELRSQWNLSFKQIALEAPKFVGSHQPYHLAYQYFENQDILSLYGSICCDLMAEWMKSIELPKTQLEACSKIKIGIISDQIRYHSVWNAITKGFVVNLNKSEFEIHLYALNNTEDEETEIARSLVSHFHHRLGDLSDWMMNIIQENFDFLIYPEVGMHSLTLQLASLRLADRQMVFWGHPETTGLPTMDYFISAELFESDGSEKVYSEKLVKLPNFGSNYSSLNTKAQYFELKSKLIHPNSQVLICPGNLYKYSPQHDWLWVEIVKQIGMCNLVFFTKNEYWQAVFQQRLEREFLKHRMSMKDYVVFIPWVGPGQFKSILSQADIFLDSIGFSGFNTAIQAIECGLPIVTMKGKFLRGSFASGLLVKLGLSEYVAKSEDDYIALTKAMLSDKSLKDMISNHLKENCNILFNDLEPIKAFERFMKFELSKVI